MTIFSLNKRRSLGLFLVVIALVVVAVYGWLHKTQDVAGGKEHALVVAFEKSDAKFQELSAQSWGKIDGRCHTLEEIHSLYTKIEKVIGKGNPMEIEEYSDEYSVGITVTGKTKEGYDLNLTLQSISDSFEEDETYLIVNLLESLDYQEAANIKTTAESYFMALDSTGETSVLISAYYPNILSPKEKTKRAKNIFAEVGGKIIEGVDSATYMSKSGYCPSIKTGVASNGKEINMQIALFDNEVQQQTCLFLGSPLIFSEY